MRAISRNLSGLCLLCLGLSACAGDSERYPSLAIRDVELQNREIGPRPGVDPVELPIRSIVPNESVASLVAQANASHQTFLSRAPSVRRLVSGAAGSGRDSEARGNALVALADLTSMRSQTEIALADLDLLVAERTNRLESAEDARSAHAQVRALIDEQTRTISALNRTLGL